MVEFSNVLEILNYAYDNGFSISLNGDKLNLEFDDSVEVDHNLLDAIKSKKEEIIHFLQKEARLSKSNDKAIPSIGAISIDETTKLPISYAQERLWFLDKLNGSINYHIPIIKSLPADLDIEALQFALTTIVKRHKVLRTVIREKENQIQQEILPLDNWKLEVCQLKEDNKEALIEKRVEENIKRPFDLTKDFMIRANLYQCGNKGYILLLVIHHIAFDGWSSGIMQNELVKLYEYKRNNRVELLPDQEIQYADYAVWQRNYLIDDTLKNKLTFWEAKLQNAVHLELPLDFTRPAIQSGRGKNINFGLDQNTSSKVHQFCKEENVTLFVFMLTCFKVLLYRYSGQTDICLGSPVANRSRKELESIIGFFVNTIALRNQVDGKQSFRSLLKQIKQSTIEAYDYQDTPFEKVVKRMGVGRDASMNPLFQVSFVLQNTPQDKAAAQLSKKVFIEQLPETTFSFYESDDNFRTSKFDFTVNIYVLENTIRFNIEYCTDLFKAATIQQLGDRYIELINAALTNRAAAVDTLNFLTNSDKQSIQGHVNQKTSFPKDKTIVDLLEEQVLKTPNQKAVVFQEESITYQALDEKSNQLAHYLKTKGVTIESKVCICIDRSIDMIIAILGVIKAGGTYVPVDPSYPKERINYILEDSNIKTAITTKDYRAIVQQANIQVLLLEEENEGIESQSKDPLKTTLTPSNAIYIIYTSGSTGKPKGVVIEHRNVVRLFVNDQKLFDFNQNDVWTLFHSFCFDFSVWEMYGALLLGGKLVIVPQETTKDATAFSQLLIKEQVTILNQTPSSFYVVQEQYLAQCQNKTSLRYVIFGGEALSPKQLAAWHTTFPQCRLINMYGITETTVHVSYKEITRHEIEEGICNIGTAIPTLDCYILDKNWKQVPPGISGEIYVAGEGVARGYWQREALNHSRFIHNPFDPDYPRLYKTGDLGKWLPNGDIEYLGRIDQQVKIRAYRIELGEIDYVLESCPLVKKAVSIASEDLHGDKRIIAYIVPENGFDKQAMLNFVSNKLPRYMVPAALVHLDAFPLTGNGKLDKSALPAPDFSSADPDQVIAPSNKIETKLLEIWKNYLGVEQLSVQDDFFDVGGHSLLATRMIAEIQKQFPVKLGAQDVFMNPTIEELAELIESKKVTAELPAISKIEPRPAVIPLSFSQERLWFINKLSGSANYHMPYIQQFNKDLNANLLEAALKEIINRQEVLRTRIIEENGKASQYINSSNDWAMDYLEIREELPFENMLKEFINRPFDLQTDYMLRAKLINCAQNHFILVVVMHHIAADGLSIQILINELKQLYQQGLSGDPIKLPPLPFQYADFSIWQRKQLAAEQLEQKIAFWQNKLQGIEPLDLPLDFSRPKIQSTAGKTLSFKIDAQTSNSLNAFCKQEGVTLFMALLTVFKILLFRYSRQSDICVGIPVANRPQKELESLLGFFVNTIALRNSIQDQYSFDELVKQIKATTLETYEYQDTPFEKVVDRLIQKRDTSRSPIFQVMFAFQNLQEYSSGNKDQFDALMLQEERSDQLKVSNIYNKSKFDLTLYAAEGLNEINLSLEYCTALFSKERIERMAVHFKQSLEVILDAPKLPIAKLDWLNQEEKDQVITRFNHTAINYPAAQTLIDLFREQVAKNPDQIAIVFENTRLTFKELDLRSEQLAHYLNKSGVTKETVVGICLNRSVEMMIGILGILKAGGAYLPIDPNYPTQRINFLLEDAEIQLLITDQSCPVLPPTVNCLKIDQEWETIKKEPSTKVKVNVLPENLMYIIYTSGSTGKPKGVMNQHDGVLNRLLWMQDQFKLNHNTDVVLQKTTFCFDVSVWELFWPLITGVKLVFATADGHKDNEYLKAVIESEQVTTLHFVPAMLETFLLDIEPFNCRSLRNVLCSGEALTAKQVNEFKTKLPKVALHNLYGPTEAAIDVTHWPVPMEPEVIKRVPIGKPVANTSIYILDKNKQPVPIGVLGELHIAGIQLARGYLNRPKLTKEKFIPVDLPNIPHKRLYKTGDLASWLPDGNILYWGRMDFQVKIKGFRIELGEIEATLSKHPTVDQVVVTIHEDTHQNKKLVAYLVGEAIDIQQLKPWLAGKLPAYMVPTFFIPIPTIPLNHNGKTDRKVLPAPELSALNANDYKAAESQTELLLAEIWEDLLGIEQISVNSNFFEIGGDSIISIQMVSRAKKKDIWLQPKDVFEYQTIAALAGKMNQQTNSEGEQGLLTGDALLLPVQQWFFEFPVTNKSHFNQSTLFAIDKLFTANDLAKLIKFVVKSHDSLRFKYAKLDGQWRQQYGQAIGEIEVVDLSNIAPTKLSDQITKTCNEYQQKLDIEQGELIKAVWIRTTKEEVHNRLFIVAHHLAIDGISWRIIEDMLEEQLENIKQGLQFNARAKTSSYRQWGLALKEFAGSAIVEQSKRHWQHIADSYQPLPTDKEAAQQVLVQSINTLTKQLNKEQTALLIQKSSQVYKASVELLLLTTLTQVITKWTKLPKIVIGMEGHGRPFLRKDIDVSSTLGWFTSIFPVLLQTNSDDQVLEQIHSVKEQFRNAPAGIMYGALRYLSPDKAIRKTLAKAKWDILFNYLGQFNSNSTKNKWINRALENKGQEISSAFPVQQKITLNSVITEGELVIHWAYSKDQYARETMEQLATQMTDQLIRLATEEVEKENRVVPSQFGLDGKVSFKELNDLFSVDESEEGVIKF